MFNAGIFGTIWWPFRELAERGLHSLYATAFSYSLVVLGLLVWQRSAVGEFAKSRQLWLLAIAAGLTNAAFNWGVVVGDVIRVVLLFYLMPVWAALLGRWLLNEQLTAGAAARIAMALAGAMLVLWQPGAGMPVPQDLGDALGLFGGFWFAMTNVLLRRSAHATTGSRMMAMFLGGSLIPGTLALGLTATALIPPPAWPPAWLMGTVILGGIMIVANMCLLYGASRLPASVTAIIMLSEVLFAAVSAVLLGAGVLSVQIVGGGLLILMAALAAARAASKPAGAAKPALANA